MINLVTNHLINTFDEFLESDELQQRLFKSLFAYVLLSFVAWALGPIFFTFVFPVLGLNQWDLFVIEYLFMSILIQAISLMPVLLGWLRFVTSCDTIPTWKGKFLPILSC